VKNLKKYKKERDPFLFLFFSPPLLKRVDPAGDCERNLLFSLLSPPNGGGCFNAPTAITHLKIFSLFFSFSLFPSPVLTYTLGRMTGSQRHGWGLFFFVTADLLGVFSSSSCRDTTGILPSPWPAMKLRFGIANSALLATSRRLRLFFPFPLFSLFLINIMLGEVSPFFLSLDRHFVLVVLAGFVFFFPFFCPLPFLPPFQGTIEDVYDVVKMACCRRSYLSPSPFFPSPPLPFVHNEPWAYTDCPIFSFLPPSLLGG